MTALKHLDAFTLAMLGELAAGVITGALWLTWQLFPPDALVGSFLREPDGFRSGQNIRSMSTKRRAMTKAGRDALWSQTQGECVYCAELIPDERRTVDHIVPVSLNGRNAAFNLVPSCFSCNVRRGAAVPAFTRFHPKWWEWAQKREMASWLRHIQQGRPVPRFLAVRVPSPARRTKEEKQAQYRGAPVTTPLSNILP